MATMVFGLFWLIWILIATVTKGFDGMSLALFTEMTRRRTPQAAVWPTPSPAAAC